MLVLCPYVSYGHLQAQIFSTSSSSHRSYSTGGTAVAPTHVEFSSTSSYKSRLRPVNQQKCYSTAPMNVANGSIKTVASSIRGGMLAEEKSTGFIPTGPQRAPGTPKPQPIGEGWDVVVLMALLCIGYVVKRYLSVRRLKGNVG